MKHLRTEAGKAPSSGKAKWTPGAPSPAGAVVTGAVETATTASPDLRYGDMSLTGTCAAPLPESLADALRLLPDLPGLSPASRRDYLYALHRIAAFFGQQPEEIPLDPDALARRLPSDGFRPDLFRSQTAYRGTRRKALAGIRAVIRETDRAAGKAGTSPPEPNPWRPLIRDAEEIARETGLSPLRLLAKEAWNEKHAPEEIDPAWLDALRDRMQATGHPGRRQSLGRLPGLLAGLAGRSAQCAALLERITRAKPATAEIPERLIAEAEAWVTAHCEGIWDEVTETRNPGRTDKTAATYLAVFSTFLSTMAGLRLIPEKGGLAECLAAPLLLQVVQHWAQRASLSENEAKADGKTPLSPKSLHSYLQVLGLFAGRQGLDTSAIARWLRSNRTLIEGARAREVMGPRARTFCIWLLSSQEAQLRFQSLHIGFYRLCLPLLEKEAREGLTPREADRLRQAGTLAAMAAILLWGAPLRIGNLMHLTIAGRAPWLILPRAGTLADAAALVPSWDCQPLPARQSRRLRPYRAPAG